VSVRIAEDAKIGVWPACKAGSYPLHHGRLVEFEAGNGTGCVSCLIR
jgi:hypothetical protein